ncbi:MAG: hypothetical protein QM579_11390 [Desulfovibrio sp.]|uniref:hypothetical protein n=1 Tax=Desulfovibrio sp. TaxID=885 RepID=UPI0039E2A1D7
MRLLLCTHTAHNGGSRSLLVPARQLARTAETPAISGMAGKNTATAAVPLFHPAPSAANIERLLTGQGCSYA